MKKYEKVSEEISLIFDSIIDSTTLPHWVRFELLSYNKQKQLIKLQKLSPVITSITDGLNFVVVINEEIFEQLPANLQRIAFEEIISGIVVTDSDAVKVESPDFSTYTGILQKYGHESIISLKESTKSLFDVKKQKEDEMKNNKPKKGFKK